MQKNEVSYDISYNAVQALKTWKKSSERKRKIILNLMGFPAIISNDNGDFLDINIQAQDILGYDKDYLLETGLYNISFSDEIETNLNTVLNNHNLLRFNDNKGQARYFFVNTYHYESYLMHIFLEVYKCQKDELSDSEEKSRLSVENTFNAICICNEQRLFYVNRQMCNLTGYSVQELLTMEKLEWICPEHRQRFQLIVEKCLRDERELSNYHIEAVNRQDERKMFECILSATMFADKPAALVRLRDISDARKIEKRTECRKVNLVIRILRVLAESKNAQEAYFNMLKAFSDVFSAYAFELCICEDDDRLEIFSLRENQPFAYKVDRLQCSQLFAAIKHKTNIYRDLGQGIKHPEDDYFYESGYKFVTSIPVEGLYNDFALFRFASFVPEENQDSRMITEIIKEIAIAMETFIYREKMKQIDRKVAEEEKNILLSKFELIGEMSASIAHQVRNPMTTVKGLAQLLLNEYPAQKQYYQLMIEEIDRANEILSEFLSLSANSFSRREKINLTDLLQEVVGIMYRKITIQGIHIQVNINQRFIGVCGDSDHLKQAFLNILINALEVSEPEDMITISADTMGDLVLISFIDQGPGIDESDIKHIIEPFYTTKDNNTGLGLSVSYKTIKDHDGELVINSQLNKGTTIEISLPLCT